MAYPEAASSRHSSSFLPVFPLELWDIIIGYLDDGGTPQHLGRLCQACPALQAVIEPRLYQHVRLRSLRGGYRLARTLESRPELRPLIREIRHKKDSGFKSNDKLVRKFYRMFANLPNLEQVFMRTTLGELVNAFNRVRRPVEELGIIQETLRWSLGLTDLVLLGDDDPDTSKDPVFTEDDFQIFGNYMLQSPKGLPALRVCEWSSKSGRLPVKMQERILMLCRSHRNKVRHDRNRCEVSCSRNSLHHISASRSAEDLYYWLSTDARRGLCTPT